MYLYLVFYYYLTKLINNTGLESFFSASVSHTDTAFPAVVEYKNSSSEYFVKFTPTGYFKVALFLTLLVLGNYIVEVSYDGKNILGSPLGVQVKGFYILFSC